MERDLLFYKRIFGKNFIFQDQTQNQNPDIVRIIDVNSINKYQNKILSYGGSLTVPEIELDNKQKIIYYSDPSGNIFALLENKDWLSLNNFLE